MDGTGEVREDLVLRDIRGTSLYREVEALYQAMKLPGTGRIVDASELDVSPDGRRVAFTGSMMQQLEGEAATRICLTELATGTTRVMTGGPGSDRSPRFSPDGASIAFLSDRSRSGNFQLYLLDTVNGATRAAPRVDGWAESLEWSPDGRRILLGVAGHGADVAGGQGAVTSRRLESADAASWMPVVETGREAHRWRRSWLYDPRSGSVTAVSPTGLNVWEAAWCGNEAVVAIVSPGPEEGDWYGATLALIDTASGRSREIFRARDQLGEPAGSPSGRRLGVIEALCSDRGIIAGDLRLIEAATGRMQTAEIGDINVACFEWCSDDEILLAGHRGFETVVGWYETTTGRFVETWSSRERTTSGRYVAVAAVGEAGDCVLVGEGFEQAPEIATILRGRYRRVHSFDPGYAEYAGVIGGVETVRWSANDGLDIGGWLLRPRAAAPHPLVIFVHGGPVWQWRPQWLGRSGALALMLLARGYALFWPNPRGSGGHGQSFAKHVCGDMGGADANDILSGIDHLVDSGVADPGRLGVTGGSYGGFMTAWLITQDSRFAAAVPVAPVTNYVTEHLISNIPHFVRLFLGDDYTNTAGKYFARSPVMYAQHARTPTLNICGARDRCTPPEEAVQFHNALREHGVESVLVTYPEEGHGIRRFPALIDFTARVTAWFEAHMASGDGR